MTQKYRITLLTCLLLASTVLTGCDQFDKQVAKIKQRAVDKTSGQTMLQPLAIWPPSSAGQYLVGRVAIGHDDLETANAAFGRAIESAPSRETVDYLIEHALPVSIGNGDDDTALQLSHEVSDVKASASGQFAVLMLLREDFNKGNWEQAKKNSANLRGDGFGQYIQPLVNVWILAGQDKIAESLGALEKASHAYPSFRSLFALHRALILDMSGQDLQAEKAYQQLLANHFSLRNGLAAADFFTRQHNKAAVADIAKQIQAKTGLPFDTDKLEASFSRKSAVANAAQGYATILFDLATVLQQENSSRLALLYARVAQPALEDQPMMNVLLGDIFMDMKDFTQARDLYKKIGQDNLFYSVSQLRLADSYALEGDMTAALNILAPLESNPMLKRQVLTQMGDLLRTDKQFDKAIPYYTQVIDSLDKQTKSDWALFYARGICHESTGQWTLAEADLRQALKLNPEQPEVLNYLGYSWADQGKDLNKAFDYIAQAHQQAPEEPYIIDSMGWVLYRMGYFKEAVPYLEESVQFLPADAVINDHLGDAYWQVGREQEARFQWERALKNSEGQKDDMIKGIKDKIANGLKKRTPQSKPLPKIKDMAQSDAIPDFFPPQFRQNAPVETP
ncbi:MAG TPA: tetratricopeptide repeat protein [Alphaproteobacteria bacterium]